MGKNFLDQFGIGGMNTFSFVNQMADTLPYSCNGPAGTCIFFGLTLLVDLLIKEIRISKMKFLRVFDVTVDFLDKISNTLFVQIQMKRLHYLRKTCSKVQNISNLKML